MPCPSLDDLLANYTALVARIDAHTSRVAALYPDDMACRKGCDECCRFLSLFPVEALALARAFENLSCEDQKRIEDHKAASGGPDDACPLLINSLCLLYPARPIICRTHGFPIYMEKDGDALVDFCPENFKGMASLPKEALLGLDQLNATLTAVNAHFLTQLTAAQILPGNIPADRIPMDQALTLCRDLGLDQD